MTEQEARKYLDRLAKEAEKTAIDYDLHIALALEDRYILQSDHFFLTALTIKILGDCKEHFDEEFQSKIDEAVELLSRNKDVQSELSSYKKSLVEAQND